MQFKDLLILTRFAAVSIRTAADSTSMETCQLVLLCCLSQLHDVNIARTQRPITSTLTSISGSAGITCSSMKRRSLAIILATCGGGSNPGDASEFGLLAAACGCWATPPAILATSECDWQGAVAAVFGAAAAICRPLCASDLMTSGEPTCT